MKILLIYPGISCIGYRSYDAALAGGSSDADSIYGLSLLAGVLREHGHTFELIDLRQLSGEEELVRCIAASDARVAGITVQTPSFDIACRVAALAQASGKITVGGGIHATVAPEDFERLPCWDHVVSGEGEIALPSLLDQIEQGQRPPRVIDGPLVEDLDSLPLPHLFPEWSRKYRAMYALEVARGCPARCTYCVSGEKKFYKRMRFRSIPHVLREIDHAYQTYPFRQLLFLDVNATTKRQAFNDLLGALNQKYPQLEVTVQERVDSFEEQTAQILARFKRGVVWFGFESTSPRILKFINKEADMDQARRAVALCKRYSLSIGANALIGIPGETDEDVQQTLAFFLEVDPDMLYCNILSPFPGTKIHQYCKEQGLLYDGLTAGRYDIRRVLAEGIIKGIDYRKIRIWHRMFNLLIRLKSRGQGPVLRSVNDATWYMLTTLLEARFYLTRDLWREDRQAHSNSSGVKLAFDLNFLRIVAKMNYQVWAQHFARL
jgi:radical SAM superfamily enzyme YgiQ (UPF0313 family)